jgi:glucose/arabinose dehydrogenase
MLRSAGIYLGAGAWGAFVAALVASCTSSPEQGDTSTTSPDGSDDLPSPDASQEGRAVIPFDDAAVPPEGTFCSLPGSVVSTASGLMVIPGGDASASELTWLNVPVGFCVHFFAQVSEVRQLRFAPGGDLFAASPSTPCAGGASGGLGAIVVLPDDDHDGVADSVTPYLSSAASTQGLAFGNGNLYFQDGTTIRQTPFQAGARKPSGAVTPVTTISAPQASEHWPKVLDIAQDGSFYITNGSSQSQECVSAASPNYVPFFGAVFKLGAGGTTSEVAKGFRNPIALRCEPDHDVCLVAELALDGSGGSGGREKLVPLRQGDDWGFPCCATQGTPYQGTTYQDTGQTPNCSGVAAENVSFDIGHTPFGIDFETGQWPAPWTGRVFVTLHGDVGSWQGARIVGVAKDPSTGLLLPATELPGGSSNPDDMMDFATGWDDGMQDHGRPAPVTFAPDGRMFVGDDMRGLVVWIAPVTLMPH